MDIGWTAGNGRFCKNRPNYIVFLAVTWALAGLCWRATLQGVDKESTTNSVEGSMWHSFTPGIGIPSNFFAAP